MWSYKDNFLFCSHIHLRTPNALLMMPMNPSTNFIKFMAPVSWVRELVRLSWSNSENVYNLRNYSMVVGDNLNALKRCK